MAIVGIGSRSSPIVIDDDDDDDGSIPPRAKSDSSSSSSVKEIPPQQSIRDTTPARQEKPDQLTSGKGYSMLVRMGYKPGHGLGVNLEGIRTLSAFLLGG
jgi:G-patch protein